MHSKTTLSLFSYGLRCDDMGVKINTLVVFCPDWNVVNPPVDWLYLYPLPIYEPLLYTLEKHIELHNTSTESRYNEWLKLLNAS